MLSAHPLTPPIPPCSAQDGHDQLSRTRRHATMYATLAGSIVPEHFGEYLIFLFGIVIGSVTWAMVVGTICATMATGDPHANAFKQRMDRCAKSQPSANVTSHMFCTFAHMFCRSIKGSTDDLCMVLRINCSTSARQMYVRSILRHWIQPQLLSQGHAVPR